MELREMLNEYRTKYKDKKELFDRIEKELEMMEEEFKSQLEELNKEVKE